LDASLEEAIQEDLRLTLFVARDVFLTPRGELSEFYLIRHGATLAPRRYRRQAGKAEEFRHLTLFQWLPKPATRWVPQVSKSLRETWSPIEAERKQITNGFGKEGGDRQNAG
jgi:hypothetical protein